MNDGKVAFHADDDQDKDGGRIAKRLHELVHFAQELAEHPTARHVSTMKKQYINVCCSSEQWKFLETLLLCHIFWLLSLQINADNIYIFLWKWFYCLSNNNMPRTWFRHNTFTHMHTLTSQSNILTDSVGRRKRQRKGRQRLNLLGRSS